MLYVIIFLISNQDRIIRTRIDSISLQVTKKLRIIYEIYERYIIEFKDRNTTQENDSLVVSDETEIHLFELHNSAHGLLQ